MTTEQNKVPCPDCGKAFATGFGLRVHRNKAHGAESPFAKREEEPLADVPDVAVPDGHPHPSDVVKRLCNHVVNGLTVELAAQAEMLGTEWRSKLTDTDVLWLRKAEAQFIQKKVNVLLEGGSQSQVNSAKEYLTLFGRENDKRRKQLKYVVFQLLTVARDFVEPKRWDEFLNALESSDTDEVVHEIDRVLGGDR